MYRISRRLCENFTRTIDGNARSGHLIRTKITFDCSRDQQFTVLCLTLDDYAVCVWLAQLGDRNSNNGSRGRLSQQLCPEAGLTRETGTTSFRIAGYLNSPLYQRLSKYKSSLMDSKLVERMLIDVTLPEDTHRGTRWRNERFCTRVIIVCLFISDKLFKWWRC